MEKISAIYKITNTITGDFYIGSSKNVKQRWVSHKCKSTWNKCPNNPMYNDMNKYGVDKFEFQVIAEVEIDSLKETEQQFIEKLKPTYNNYNAKGLDIERCKETKKKYNKSDKGKEYHRKASNKYQKTNKGKESHRKASNKYNKSDKGKETQRKASNKYNNQLCLYNGETLTLAALSKRFRKAGIPHPTLEAKKYIVKESNNPIEFYDVYP